MRGITAAALTMLVVVLVVAPSAHAAAPNVSCHGFTTQAQGNPTYSHITTRRASCPRARLVIRAWDSAVARYGGECASGQVSWRHV